MNSQALALEAFTFAYPLYEMARMRAATSPRRLPGLGFADATAQGPLRWCNIFVHRRELMGAGDSRVVTPNNDTLYSNAWLDLAAGPLVIDVPDTAGRYYVLGLLDFFTNPFAHLGARRHGTAAGAFLISGPGWQGEVPAAFQAEGRHVRCATRWVWIIGRWLVDGEHDYLAVHALQDALQLRPLAAWLQGGLAVPQRFDPGFELGAALTAEHFAVHFITQVNRALRDQPALPQDAAQLERWAQVGIGPAAALPPAPEHTALMAQAIESGRAQLQAGDGGGHLQAGWTMPPVLGESFGVDYRRRAEVALKYIGALESREAHYPMAWPDEQGQALHGNRAHRLHFAADGALTLHIQHSAPAAPEALANWLPAPEEAFYLCLRAYLPRPELLDGRYRLPAVKAVNLPPSSLKAHHAL